jgi:hypothetical protein
MIYNRVLGRGADNPEGDTVLASRTGASEDRASLAERWAAPFPTLVMALLFAGLVATSLRIAWNPPARSYLEYVPIGAVFAAFLWDRLLPRRPKNARLAAWDGLVVALALMRVFIPPLPFVSGHTLFATYAALTARRWPLRAIALVVLAEVMYMKVFVSGGWGSMVGGLAVACIAAAARRPTTRAPHPSSGGVCGTRPHRRRRRPAARR